MFRLSAASLVILPTLVAAQSCPQVHVFGARETTVSSGYGTAGSVVNSIVSAYSGATAEAINYPACGGQSSCGGVSYANSVQQGVQAVANQVNSFNQRCPNTVLVLVGYSQVGVINCDLLNASLTWSCCKGWSNFRRRVLRRWRQQRGHLQYGHPDLVCCPAENCGCHLHG
jgi:hypothetical protein